MRNEFADLTPSTDTDLSSSAPPAVATTASASTAPASDKPAIEKEVLIEEVSIDGMCGVY